MSLFIIKHWTWAAGRRQSTWRQNTNWDIKDMFPIYSAEMMLPETGAFSRELSRRRRLARYILLCTARWAFLELTFCLELFWIIEGGPSWLWPFVDEYIVFYTMLSDSASQKPLSRDFFPLPESLCREILHFNLSIYKEQIIQLSILFYSVHFRK